MSRDRQKTDLIVVTDSQTPSRRNIGTRTLAKEAVDRGVYSDSGPLGVHFLIRRSGTIEIGRDMRSEGQHLLGFNDCSVYVMLVGGVDNNGLRENNFNQEQFKSLKTLVECLWLFYPGAILAPQDALCGIGGPGFDFWMWEETTIKSGHERRLMEYLARRPEQDPFNASV